MREAWDWRRAGFSIEDITAPALIIGAKNDEHAPFNHAKHIARRLAKTAGQVTLRCIRNADHHVGIQQTPVAIDWCAQKLKDGA